MNNSIFKLFFYSSLIAVFIFLLTNNGLKAQPNDYYKPRALITPGHYDYNQFTLTLGYDGGFDINLSYSLPKGIALIAAGNVNPLSHFRFGSVDYTIHKNDLSGMAGLGYYKNRKYKYFNVFEIYTGANISMVDNFVRWETSTLESNDRITKALYNTYFLQIQTNTIKEKYGFTLATRISMNHYRDFEYYLRSKTTTNVLSGSFNLFAAEPALGVFIPIRNFKANVQLGVSIPVYTQEAQMVETIVASNVIKNNVENYGEFYFFWRLSLYYIKSKHKIR
jgi:hypothetical protein